MTSETDPRYYLVTHAFLYYWQKQTHHPAVLDIGGVKHGQDWKEGDILKEVFSDVYYPQGVTVSGSEGSMFLSHWELSKVKKIEMGGTINVDESP